MYWFHILWGNTVRWTLYWLRNGIQKFNYSTRLTDLDWLIDYGMVLTDSDWLSNLLALLPYTRVQDQTFVHARRPARTRYAYCANIIHHQPLTWLFFVQFVNLPSCGPQARIEAKEKIIFLSELTKIQLKLHNIHEEYLNMTIIYNVNNFDWHQREDWRSAFFLTLDQEELFWLTNIADERKRIAFFFCSRENWKNDMIMIF